ncbi:hypothetical protein Syun_027407 [Stephania yunnanensis]|uniref:Uncharacterized protein n=1 Tax=Stephania yunnanensis TaxID=152371 RepID=A0AAP0EFJ9_9MAGN
MRLPPSITSPRNYASASANANTPSITPPPPPNAPFDNTTSTPQRIPVPHLRRAKSAPPRPPSAPSSTTPPPSSNTSPPPSSPAKNYSTNAKVGVVTSSEREAESGGGCHRRRWPLEPQGVREGEWRELSATDFVMSLIYSRSVSTLAGNEWEMVVFMRSMETIGAWVVRGGVAFRCTGGSFGFVMDIANSGPGINGVHGWAYEAWGMWDSDLTDFLLGFVEFGLCKVQS